MTKLLQQAVQKLSALSEDRQDELARMLIDAAADGAEPYTLTSEERADMEESLRELDRGEVASDEEVAAVYARHCSQGHPMSLAI